MIEFNTLDGKQRGLKFGTYTFRLINELAGTKTISEVFDGLSSGNMDFATHFYFACAKHYVLSKKQPVDFTSLEVMDWLDELGMERLTEITAELLNTYTEKNLKAPTMGQQTEV